LILPSMTIEQIIVFALYALSLIFCLYQKKLKLIAMNHNMFQQPERALLIMTFLMFFAACGVVMIFKLRSTPGGDGIPLRHYIFLVPVSIIAMTLFTINLMKALRGQIWMQINMGIALGGLLIMNFVRHGLWMMRIY